MVDRFEAMRTLVAAVDGGACSVASRSLNVPLPTVSRRVSDLESFLGSPARRPHQPQTPAHGSWDGLCRVGPEGVEELSEAERAASGEYRAPRGELLVTAPIAFGALNVAPIVHDFLGAYPDVTVRLVLSDSTIDLIETHVDVAVRIGRLPDSSLVARRVGEIRWVVCASPDYLVRRGKPETPDALAHHDCIAFEGLQRYREWPFVDGKVEQQVTINPRFSVNTADGVVGGAVAGVGIARVLSYQAVASIRAGSLVPILVDRAPLPMPVYLVHAPHQQQPLKLRAFLDFVAPRLQQRLQGSCDGY